MNIKSTSLDEPDDANTRKFVHVKMLNKSGFWVRSDDNQFTNLEKTG